MTVNSLSSTESLMQVGDFYMEGRGKATGKERGGGVVPKALQRDVQLFHLHTQVTFG